MKEPFQGPLRCLAALSDGVILIDSEGAVFSAGDNDEGQLGRSSAQDIDEDEDEDAYDPTEAITRSVWMRMAVSGPGDGLSWAIRDKQRF